MNQVTHYLNSSIGRKQIVAATGLILILFVTGHLAGNLFIYGGEDAFNGYAKKMASLRPALNFVEAGLLFIFIVHMWVTTLLVLDNIKARGTQGYSKEKAVGNRSWATRLMPYTGTAILVFVIFHLLDFTFVDHHGPRSILSDGKSYGLYGVVLNSFNDVLHSALYILAVICVGLHLSHGVESFFQTFGLNDSKCSACIKTFSHFFALVVTVGYCSIPIFVLLFL